MASSSISSSLSSSTYSRRLPPRLSFHRRCLDLFLQPMALPSSSRLLFLPPCAFNRFFFYPKITPHCSPSPFRRIADDGYGRTKEFFSDRKIASFERKHDVEMIPDTRRWVGDLRGHGFGEDDSDQEDDDQEEKDRSLDLLVRFFHSVFRKISRRARRAVCAMLPSAFPTALVRFSVDGVLILASLWIIKSFLEVICTFGSMVLVSILLVRGIWSAISYARINRHSYLNMLDNDDTRWDNTQAA